MVDYEQLWAKEEFRNKKCRSFLHCDLFLSLQSYVKKNTNSKYLDTDDTVTDWGCGNGSHAEKMLDMGLDVVGLNDIASNSLSRSAEQQFGSIFQGEPLWSATPRKSCFSYCSDVLEHLSEDKLDEAIKNIVDHTKRPGFVFLNVASIKDVWRGMDLHETVRPFKWWMDKFIDAIPGVCVFSYNLRNSSLGTFWFLPL